MLVKFRSFSPYVSCIVIIFILSSTAYGTGYGHGQKLYPTHERITIPLDLTGLIGITAVLAGTIPWIAMSSLAGSDTVLRVLALGNGRNQPPTINKQIAQGNINSAQLLVLGLLPYLVCIQNFQVFIFSNLAGSVQKTAVNDKAYSALSAFVYQGQIYILAYNDQTYTLEMICGTPGSSWTTLFTFKSPVGSVVGPFFGYPMWRFFPVEDGFVFLGEVYTTNGPQLMAFRVNREGQVEWDRVLHLDFEPNASPAVYLTASLAVLGSVIYGAYIRRADQCLILYTLNLLTGTFVAKPVFINHTIPQQLHTLRFLSSPVGLALLSMGPVVGGYLAFLSLIYYRGSPVDKTMQIAPRDVSSTSGGGFTVRTQELTEAGVFKSPAAFALELGENETIESFPYAKPWLVGGDTASLGATVYAVGFPPLNYPQFADGADIFSELTFTNNDPGELANVTLEFRDQQGQLIPLDRSGEQIVVPGSSINGQVNLKIPPNGRRSIISDSKGDVLVGSVTAYADRTVSGTTLFGGPIGLAGISNSPSLTSFSAQVDSDTGEGINTGIAVMNTGDQEITLKLQLCNIQGTARANAETTIPPRGQISLFASQFDWDSNVVDFNSFRGVIKVTVEGGNAAGVVIQTRPNQIAPLEVTGN